MSLAVGPQEQLPNHHHVARHCRARDMADGIPRENAFRLRQGEEFLSTNWLEHFHGSDRQVQIAGAQQALTDKGFRIRRNAAFAVLNVGAAMTACQSELNVNIRIAALGESRDPSHTGIFGYSANDTDVAAVLARQVKLEEVYPATA